MAFEKKTWADRVAEFINRRILTKEDGSTELVTVARSEGTISVEGDAFNAETMNDLEQRIANGFEYIDDEFNSLFNSDYKKASDTTSLSHCPAMYTKRSGWVHVVYTGNPVKMLSANEWTVVTKLPEGYRPVCNIPFVWNYGTYTFIGYVYTNGNIVVYPTELIASNYQVVFSVSYPVA